MVFHLALKNAGRKPQTLPAAMAATRETRISAALGSLSPRQIMQAAVARHPMSTWPSAPMFQKRILNAGVTAREMPSSTARFWNVTQDFRAEPKAPLKMVA